MNRPIMSEAIESAVKNLPRNKNLGPDGKKTKNKKISMNISTEAVTILKRLF